MRKWIDVTTMMLTETIPVWQSWWFNGKTGEIITLDGTENAHWRYAAAHFGDRVLDKTRFQALLTTGDIEDDDEDRQLFKFIVFESGWVRVGLVDHQNGYVDANRKSWAVKAANWLWNESKERLTRLDYGVPQREVRYRFDSPDEINNFLRYGFLATAINDF